MGVAPEKPKITPVVIHDKEDSSPWPIAAAIFVIVVLAVLIFEHKQTAQEVAQLGTNSGPALVVNNHSPLFQSGVSTPPQLAHVASIKTATPAPVADDTQPADDQEDDPTDPTYDDTPSIPAVSNSGQEAVVLSDAQIASQDDGTGHEIAIGSVTIENPSQFEISNYRLYVATGGGTYGLEPFTGSVDDPVSIDVRTIPAGGRITVPVMSRGIMSVNDQYAAKTVTVEATENGVSVTNNVTVD